MRLHQLMKSHFSCPNEKSTIYSAFSVADKPTTNPNTKIYVGVGWIKLSFILQPQCI